MYKRQVHESVVMAKVQLTTHFASILSVELSLLCIAVLMIAIDAEGAENVRDIMTVWAVHGRRVKSISTTSISTGTQNIRLMLEI